VLGEGVAHEHVESLLHLILRTPVFADVREGKRNAFERSSSGALIERGLHDVPCTLLVPRSIGGAALPVVLFQHGVSGERSDALPVANELASAGYATLTCDAPVHGSRLVDADTGNRFTGSSEPDGFGDVLGDLLGRDADAGELAPLHPFYYRDAVQQAVVDWTAIVETLRLGLWDEPLSAALGRDDAALARDDIGFIGVDLGAEIGVALAGRELEIATLVLAFAGGRSLDDWRVGPDYGSFRAALDELLPSEDPQRFDPAFRVDVDVLRSLLDPATGLARAGRLRRTTTNLLAFVASEDELVPLASSEALAYALGASLIGADPSHELALQRAIVVLGATLSGNVPLARGSVTRVLQSLSPATHATLFANQGIVRFEHPLRDEPALLNEEQMIENPTAAVMAQIVFFFQSHRACSTAEPAPELPCAASVSALSLER
jgi:dienelactone hydrolase